MNDETHMLLEKLATEFGDIVIVVTAKLGGFRYQVALDHDGDCCADGETLYAALVAFDANVRNELGEDVE